jgi:DNA adenine methylase
VELLMGRSYSPLRYPGGKGKLALSVARIISDNKLTGGHYAEPYAGGAAVGIFLLFHEYVSTFHLNDLDPAIFAFWHTVLNETEWLCHRIREVKITPEEWRKQRQVHSKQNASSRRDLGFATFFLNRTNRSGIIKGGGMIGGTEQLGKWKLDVRFNRESLIDRIQDIASFGPRIKLTNLDAEEFLKRSSVRLPEKSLMYLDPPYFEKGPGLYQSHYQVQDHVRIAKKINKGLKHKWLVSYDAHPAIVELYSEKRHLVYDLRYQASKKYLGKEIMIFSDDLLLKGELNSIFPVPLAV